MKQLLTTFFILISLTLSAQNVSVSYDESSNSIVFGNNRYKMIHVSGGSFNMGATLEQGSDALVRNNAPVHRVTLSSYYIGQTEVTQALWQAVMGDNPSYFRGTKRPVEQVNWKECQTFISRLNSLTGRNFCLPTEAQWEFAARGGNNSFHYKYSGSNNIENVAVYQTNSLDRGSNSPDYGTHNVASRQSNELGIYDMSGNVGEWCSDMYGYYDRSPQTNPTGAKDGGSFRVWRGGCWQDRAGYCRTATRLYNTYGRRNNGVGLRLALVPSSSRTKYVTDSRSSTQVQQKVNQPQPTTMSNATGSENGHGYVDLGLSVMWATCNLGANNPSEHGDYYAWGETRTKSDCDWSTLKYCLNSRGSKFSKYVTISNCGSIDNKTILDPEDDAAHVNWGGSWRMPTKAELEELLKKCTWTKTFQNGVEGRKITGPNGNYIFLPATGQRISTNLSGAGSYGYYWSSSLDTSYSGYAYYLGFSSSLEDWNYCYRYYGNYVRAVCTKPSTQVLQNVNQPQSSTVRNATPPKNAHAYVDLGLSVKWATCNVGANSPEEFGNFFAWGETVGYTSNTSDGRSFNAESYKLCNGSMSKMTKYCTDSQYGTVDNKTVLAPEDDAAHVNWGGSWRMPTMEEIDELCADCTWTETSLNGKNGFKVTGPNGKSIFLPFTGYREDDTYSNTGFLYWSSSIRDDSPTYAYGLGFESYSGEGRVEWYSYDRYDAFPVRAVHP